MPLRDIAGHRALLALLSRAAARSALPQSLIFAGPDGVGKRLTAVAVAQLLNCTSRIDGPDAARSGLSTDACGTCSPCRRIAQLVHPDVVLVPANPSIDDAREVMQAAAYRPFEGHRRVFILDDADAMSAVVQNAWLKRLEEPPSTCYFILVASRPDLLLPTVRSRCPSLRFGRLPVDEVTRILVDRHGVEPQLAREVAFASDGSPGRALLEASDSGSATRALIDRILEEATNARTPQQRLRVAARLLEAVDTKVRGRGKGASRFASEREMLGERLDVLSGSLRDLGVVAVGAEERFMSRAPSADMLASAQRWSADRLTRAF
jgi:DNA polymerase III subunit delta'